MMDKVIVLYTFGGLIGIIIGMLSMSYFQIYQDQKEAELESIITNISEQTVNVVVATIISQTNNCKVFEFIYFNKTYFLARPDTCQQGNGSVQG